jgi:hypothetical protein
MSWPNGQASGWQSLDRPFKPRPFGKPGHLVARGPFLLSFSSSLHQTNQAAIPRCHVSIPRRRRVAPPPDPSRRHGRCCCAPPGAGPVTRGRQFKSETLSPKLRLGRCRPAPRAHRGPGWAGPVLVRPVFQASGLPRQPGWPGVPASRPPRGASEREQGCGAWSQGQLGLAGTWARAKCSRPASGQVPPISRGECNREVLGHPPAEGPSAGQCPAATSLTESESAFLR